MKQLIVTYKVWFTNLVSVVFENANSNIQKTASCRSYILVDLYTIIKDKVKNL